jgi:LCP family protein required for cell wall assembly
LRTTLLALLVLLLVASVAALREVSTLGQAISAQSPLTSQTGYMLGLGRVNVLVLGYGGGAHDGANLTDSLMVLSLDPRSGATAMVSVPRDLWMQVPPDSNQFAKINTAYEVGLANGYAGLAPGRDAGAALAARQVSDVTGLDVSYWVTLNFTGFRSLVDALGGVDLTVPTAFTANYPRNDDPNIDAGWKTIHFDTGRQHMDGERAIEYARARYVLEPASEGTDFARSARQQFLVRAIFGKARQPGEWPRLAGASKQLGGALYSNLSLTDLALFAEKLDFNHARHIGLTTQNVLVGATSDDGQAILLPANDDWNGVRQYVAQQMGG